MSNIIKSLTTIKSASGKLKKGPDGRMEGVLSLTTESDPLDITIDEFDAIYRGFVSCWPVIKPLKDELLQERRKVTIQTKVEEREKAKEQKKAEKAAERKAAKDARDAKLAQEKTEKEAAKVKAKAEKEAKAKADAKRLKEAAELKAKKDKAAKK